MSKGSIALAAFLAAAVPATVLAADAPARKAGLWTLHVTVSNRPAPMTSSQCTDAASERRITIQGYNRAFCRDYALVPAPDGYRYHAQCSLPGGGGRTVMDGTVKGDLADHYVVDLDQDTTGSHDPRANRKLHVQMEAKWSGPCPPNQVPGDTVYDGKTFNVFNRLPLQ